ncbi:MAG: universal stress protein [Maribacter sp.]
MKKIIVPVDFSKYSEYALEASAILARKHNAEITVLHMLELSDYISQSQASRNNEMMFMLALANKKIKEFLNKDYLKDLAIAAVIKHDKVFKELGKVSEELNADLIIMGSHGLSDHEGVLTGSNTEKVVRYSETPVLVIKTKPENLSIDRIVYGTDFSEQSIPSFRKASGLLESLGGEITLLHINLPYGHFDSSDEIEAKMNNFLEKADGDLSKKDKVVIRADYTVEAGILNYAEKINADLVAMNTHGRTGLSHFLSGSISEDLANHANLPVMVFKL